MPGRSRNLRPVPESPRRAVALIRVSKARGRDDLISPELQRTAITDYAARQGISVVEWVEALDESGSQRKSHWWRKLDKAVGQVEAGEFEVVLVYKFHRAARHRRNWAVALDRVEVAGGTIESATEGVDTTTSTGRFTRGMLAEFAAFEAERIGEGWKETHARRVAMGLPHHGFRRYGYTYTHDGYTPDPDEAPLVVECYRRYAEGLGIASLTAWAKSAGMLSPKTGRPWTPRGLIAYLDTGFAAGLLNVRGQLLPGAHPPLIGERLWAAYRAQRERMRQVPSRLHTPSTRLAGLVRCGSCGYAMRAKSSPRYGPAYIYACETFDCTRRASVSRTRAERAVRDWLAELAAEVDRLAESRTATTAAKVVARSERTLLARQAASLRTQMQRLTVDEYAKGLIPAGVFAASMKEMEDALADVEARLRLLEEQITRPAPTRTQVRGLLACWDTDPQEAHQLARLLVGKVEVVRQDGQRPHVRVWGAWECPVF